MMPNGKLSSEFVVFFSIEEEILTKSSLRKEKVEQYKFNFNSGLESPALRLSIQSDMRSVDALFLTLGKQPIYETAIDLLDGNKP